MDCEYSGYASTAPVDSLGVISPQGAGSDGDYRHLRYVVTTE
jgi:hypothetical protein